MPTLVDVPVMDESMMSAASSSSSVESNHDDPAASGTENEQETFMNDSTRLFDETILDSALTPGSSHRLRNKTVPVEDSEVDANIDNDETRLGDVTIIENNNNENVEPYEKSVDSDIALLDFEKPEPAVRTIGPQQEHYTRNFERYVSHVIADFCHRHPEKLRDYSLLSPSEKRREQERINNLLARLGAPTGTATVQHSRTRHVLDSGVALAEASGYSSATRLSSDNSHSLVDQASDANSQQENDSSATLFSREQNQDADMQEHNLASPLLSSESEVDELAARMSESMVVCSPARVPARTPPQTCPDSDSSASSVELARRNKNRQSSPYSNLYESPTITTNRSKRLASISGKRGTDASRMKIDEDSFVSFDASVARGSERISSSSQLLCSSIKSPESPLFHASQSPIPDDFSSAEKHHVNAESNRRLEVFDDQEEYAANDDTLQSLDVTGNHRRRVKWNDESFLHEIPANVRLKDGVSFRMKPLPVGRPQLRQEGNHRRISLADIPDPLQVYQGTLRKKIKAAYAWIKVRDAVSDDEDMMKCGLLFSMDERIIIDVTMKLFLKHPSNHNDFDMIDEVLRGGTLVVLRDKEDLVKWQSALRECTPFSVLSHATMPVEERKRASTANRCAGHDIVVTTFDALKSKDVTTTLDENGHVVHEKVGCQDGWYSARSSGSESQKRCEQLSVLHQVSWRRVIFVDCLGRKCFLAKPGTARAVASVALCASSRFLFFPDALADKVSPMKALAKSDRNAFKSVAAALHLSEDVAAGGLTDCIFDMNDALPSKSIRHRSAGY